MSNTPHQKPEQPPFFIKKGPISPIEPGNTRNIHVLASKKEFKNAIRRNKVRRRIKEAYRAAIKQINPKSTQYLKINAKIGALKTDFKNITESIKKELSK